MRSGPSSSAARPTHSEVSQRLANRCQRDLVPSARLSRTSCRRCSGARGRRARYDRRTRGSDGYTASAVSSARAAHTNVSVSIRVHRLLPAPGGKGGNHDHQSPRQHDVAATLSGPGLPISRSRHDVGRFRIWRRGVVVSQPAPPGTPRGSLGRCQSERSPRLGSGPRPEG